MSASWEKPRELVERVVVTGALVLETPTHLGSGDADGPLDMPLIEDPLEGRALLTGSSIAGALRAYVHQRDPNWAERLFGKVTSATSHQSRLIVDDAIGELPRVELRDGVEIDPKTRTAAQGKKYDIELLEAGTVFNLRFELLVREADADKSRKAFALALQGLENGDIRLGKRKRRGFGECRVHDWSVQRYDMTTPQGMVSWLKQGAPASTDQHIAGALKVSLDGESLRTGDWLTLSATFTVDGSLLIRSSSGGPKAPDAVQLRSKRKDGEKLILSGTSIAGALRGRAVQIVNTFNPRSQFVLQLFGGQRDTDGKKALVASRVWVSEVEIHEAKELVQTRLKIDRFTGGAYPGALFSEQAAFGAGKTTVTLKFQVQNPSESDAGLLLLLLKDLWTGDLPLGGGNSVGRGRLTGQNASLRWDANSFEFALAHDQNGRLIEPPTLVIESAIKDGNTTPQQVLQTYVDAFHKVVMRHE